MKEIKYRAWDKKRKRMCEVEHLHWSKFEGIWATVKGYDIIQQKDISLQIQPKDCIVMPYTHANDMEEHEIYDGDIVSVVEADIIRIIEWDPNELEWQCNTPGGDICRLTKWNAKRQLKVIGNIYQNETIING